MRNVKASDKGLTVKFLFLYYYVPELYMKYGNTVMSNFGQTPYDSIRGVTGTTETPKPRRSTR